MHERSWTKRVHPIWFHLYKIVDKEGYSDRKEIGEGGEGWKEGTTNGPEGIGTNLDATRDSHTKWNKSEREGRIPYDITNR